MKKKILLIALSLTVAASAFSFGRGGRHGGPCGRNGGRRGFGPGLHLMNPQILNQAGVSQAKQDKIREIMFTAFEEKAKIRIKIRRLKWDIREKILKGSTSNLLSSERQIAKLKSQMYMIRAKAKISVFKILGPATMKKLRELGFQRGGRRGYGPGSRRGRGRRGQRNRR